MKIIDAEEKNKLRKIFDIFVKKMKKRASKYVWLLFLKIQCRIANIPQTTPTEIFSPRYSLSSPEKYFRLHLSTSLSKSYDR